MSAPPVTDDAVRDGSEPGEPTDQLEDELGPDWLVGPSIDPPLAGPEEEREDPADDVVAVGQTPPLHAPIKPKRISLPPMPNDRLRSWLVTGVITAVGAFLRIWGFASKTNNGTPVFDEAYYAVQAAEMIRTGGYEDNQAYGVIVHPPLGKQIIAIGELIFGYDPTGWRITSVIAGILVIAITIRVARRLTRSTLLGAIAGVLIVCDGVSEVMARAALMDIFSEVFVIAAFACLIADRDQVRRRLHAAIGGENDTILGGVPLGPRWWRFAAGVLLGCLTAVKWNGAYWVAFLLPLAIIWNATARKDAGIRRPVLSSFRRDLLPTIWSLGVVPVLTYLASYWAWFASENAYGRHMSGASGIIGTLKSWWLMTYQMYVTSKGIITDAPGVGRHPWESKPFAWPMSLRPLLTYLASNTTGCGPATETDCQERIFIIGTASMWFLAFFVAGWAVWRMVARCDWRYAAVVVAYSGGYLPWFAIFDRQMYFFYMTPEAPFLILGITLVLGDVLGRARKPAGHGQPAGRWLTVGSERRLSSMIVVAIYVGIVVANFIWLWPMLVGAPMTPARLTAETWLPSWG